MRVSYTGELGWELHHDLDDQVALYDALKGVAGVAPPADFGFYAMDSMRMEKAYRAWGVELTVENTAWELGLDRFVVLGGRDFIGRQALVEQRRVGVGRRLFFAEVDTVDTDIIGGEAVFRKGRTDRCGNFRFLRTPGRTEPCIPAAPVRHGQAGWLPCRRGAGRMCPRDPGERARLRPRKQAGPGVTIVPSPVLAMFLH